MERAIKYYSIPNDNCTCRDENGDLTKISLRYREFYEKIKSGWNYIRLSRQNLKWRRGDSNSRPK